LTFKKHRKNACKVHFLSKNCNSAAEGHPRVKRRAGPLFSPICIFHAFLRCSRAVAKWL
jgi:hypothetical protein